MSDTAILGREFRAEILKASRMPEFAIPTIVLPVAFFALFGLALAKGSSVAPYLLATYGIFAAIGPSVFGFGIGVATEREEGTLALKAVSPMPAFVYPLAKLMMTVVFVALVDLAIYGLGTFGGGASFSPARWAGIVGVHLAAIVPFSLIGLFLGYTLKSQAAIAVGNIIFFSLCILGGLWIPLPNFPAFMQTLAWALPSFHLAQLALIEAGMQTAEHFWLHIAATLAWTAVLAGLVAWAVRREAD